MRKYIFLLFLFVTTYTNAQDYSFSQFDLNMMYSNPAFAGFESNNRVLLHRRNQWMGIAEKFNTNILEFNLSKNLKTRSIAGGMISWAGGFYIIENHENKVFKTYNIGLIPWTFHFQLPYNSFISMGMQNVISYKTLDWNQLVFSDEIDELGLTGVQTSANQPVYLEYTNWFDPSFGFILTKHSKFQKQSGQVTSVGFAMHHLNKAIESFYNNQASSSGIPIKYTLHAEHIGVFPDFVSKTFKFWKVFARHESQGERTMQKDEIGFTTTLANNLQLEAGTIYRIGRYSNANNNGLMSESIIPLIRMRLMAIGGVGMEVSYSYDFNISKLNNMNTTATNEINLNFYFIKSKPRTCPAQGKWGKNKKWENVFLNRGKYNRSNKSNRWNW